MSLFNYCEHVWLRSPRYVFCKSTTQHAAWSQPCCFSPSLFRLCWCLLVTLPPPFFVCSSFSLSERRLYGGEGSGVSQPMLLLKYCWWRGAGWMPCGAVSQGALQHPHLVFVHLYETEPSAYFLCSCMPRCVCDMVRNICIWACFEYRFYEGASLLLPEHCNGCSSSGKTGLSFPWFLTTIKMRHWLLPRHELTEYKVLLLNNIIIAHGWWYSKKIYLFKVKSKFYHKFSNSI